MKPLRATLTAGLLLGSALTAASQPFLLPTANHALYEPNGEEQFFVGTPGRPWISGAFGCVRNDGWKIHEGLDIRALEKDRNNEPTDPVLATADGVVVYINRKASESNYGIYVVIRHSIQGIEIYSLYAHLSEVVDGLAAGQPVCAGAQIAVMGRTTNTRTRISKDRAHVHFELNLLMNDAFPAWFAKTYPTQENDHGLWHGYNLLGLDPRQILLTQQLHGDSFDLAHVIRSQPELMRVAVRSTDFPWLHRYPQLIKSNPSAISDGVAGYEIAFNCNGVAYELIPRSEDELPSKNRVTLLSVSESEYDLRPCRKLVTPDKGSWRLTESGKRLVDLLLY